MTRIRSGAALLAALALTACGSDPGGPAAAPATTTATATPSAAPSASAAASGATVPAAALLQAADLNGVTPEADADVAGYLRPPRPCNNPHPSESARLASAAVRAMIPGNGEHSSPSVLLETIVRYRPGAGAQAFTELTDAVRRCPGQLAKDKRRWEIVGNLSAGDQAVVLRTTTRFEYGDDTNLVTHTTPVAVARVGDDLILLADLGWETASGDEAKVRTLIVKAVERLRAAG